MNIDFFMSFECYVLWYCYPYTKLLCACLIGFR